MSFKPEAVRSEVWKKLLDKVAEISGREEVRHDICLIGSHARGDASPISDIDLVLFAEGETNLKHAELFYLNNVPITIFPVDVTRLIGAESIDFYKANNSIEARLVHGEGGVLEKVREGVSGKRIDLEATKRITGETLSNRLLGALGDALLDICEGIRDMRVCLGKVKLYRKLLVERVDPWSLIPYTQKAESHLETMLEKLYHSGSYEELAQKIKGLRLGGLMEIVFREHLEVIFQVVEKLVDQIGFPREHMKNYLNLYLMVEEEVRSRIWSMLPGRWKVEEDLKPDVNQYRTNISYRGGRVSWIVSWGEGDSLKLKEYGTTEFLSNGLELS